MARGRKSTPTKIRLLRGNPGKRPLPTNEPMPPMASVEAPAWLSDRAKAHWTETAPRLVACGLLTVLDTHAWAMACTAFSHYRELGELLERDGLVLISEEGSAKLHPAIRLEQKWFEAYLKIAADFGATPRGRVGLSVHLPSEDELDAFLAQGKQKTPAQDKSRYFRQGKARFFREP